MKEIAMSSRLPLVTLILTIGLILTAGSVRAVESAEVYLAANAGMENTERNTRDRENATLTPEDQKESSADVDITAAIRAAIVKDETLSLNAHNAKIITRNGVVTLRGPVESEAEKSKLQLIAQSVKGVQQIDNQLEVKAP
jgi:hyperosmotically inducible protein